MKDQADMQISLRTTGQADIETIRKWARDIRVEQYQSRYFPRLFDGSNLSNAEDAGLWSWYIIVVDGQDAGTVWLEKETPEDETVILGIMLAGEEFFSRGIGREAVRLAVEQAQDQLPFKSVVLTVRRDNPRAFASYRHCGFAITSEGLREGEGAGRVPYCVMRLELD